MRVDSSDRREGRLAPHRPKSSRALAFPSWSCRPHPRLRLDHASAPVQNTTTQHTVKQHNLFVSGSIHVPDRFQLFVLSLASDHTSTHIVTNETKRSSWLVYLPLSAYVATGWPLSFPRGSGLLHTPKQARPLHVSCSIVYMYCVVSSTPSIERAVSAAIDARCSVQL